MQKFSIAKVQGYHGAQFPQDDKIGASRSFLSRILGFVKITFGIALFVTLLETPVFAQNEPCGGVVALPEEAEIQYERAKLSQLAKDPQPFNNQTRMIKGTLIEIYEKVGEGEKKTRFYLTVDKLRVLLTGPIRITYLNKSVEVIGKITVVGDFNKQGLDAVQIVVTKINPAFVPAQQ